MRRVKVFLLSVAWPLLVAAVFALLFRSVYEQNGMIDLPLAWILIGIPFGIRQVCSSPRGLIMGTTKTSLSTS